MKRKIFSVLLVLTLVLSTIFCGFGENTAHAKSFVTNKKFVGTYGYKGKKGSFKSGWYNLIIDKITPDGKVRFQIDSGGANGNRLCGTYVLTAKIVGNKATFKYKEDGWGNKGKGSISFQKNGTIFLTVKQTYTSEYCEASLEIPKTIFKKTSKKHKLSTY